MIGIRENEKTSIPTFHSWKINQCECFGCAPVSGFMHIVTNIQTSFYHPLSLKWRQWQCLCTEFRGLNKITSFTVSVLGFSSVQFISVAQSCLTLCDPMNLSTPGLPVHHQLPEFTQTHVHPVGDAIQPSHSLSSPSPPAPNPSQHQGLFQWVSSSRAVAKVLELQLQHQSFQWTPRTDLL